jgi:hypothetical protein
MKTDFKVTGTLSVPDNAIKHYDVAGKLYALEFNSKMYMLQVCLVAENSDGEYEMIHQYDEMLSNDISDLRYDEAEFFEG